jgi:AcrR family transcriptional regulator
VTRPRGKRALRREVSIAGILDAAEQLFSENGYEPTSMQDVVKAAGTSIGNLYFYFENKEQLLQALTEKALIEAHQKGDELAARVAPGPARMAVVVFANAFVLLEPGTRFLGILLQTNGKALSDHVAKRNADRIRSYLVDNIPGVEPRMLDTASNIWSGAGRGAIESYVRDPSVEVGELAEYLTRWNLRGVSVPEVEIDAAIAVAKRIIAEAGLA